MSKEKCVKLWYIFFKETSTNKMYSCPFQNQLPLKILYMHDFVKRIANGHQVP